MSRGFCALVRLFFQAGAEDRRRGSVLTGTAAVRDRQDETPAAWCRYCRGEIYEGEDYYRVDGRAVCTDCLDRLAADYFRLYRVRGGS